MPIKVMPRLGTRPEVIKLSRVIMADLKPARALDAIDLAVAHYAGRKQPFRTVADYTADNVSRKVVRIILSYTDYVNRTVWHR